VLDREPAFRSRCRVVFIEVNRRLGVATEGVSFPGHFLVRVAGERGPVLLDPFFGAAPWATRS